MKKIIVLLMCCLVLGGCGSKDIKTSTEKTEENETAKETQAQTESEVRKALPNWYVKEKKELLIKAKSYLDSVEEDYGHFNKLIDDYSRADGLENLEDIKTSMNELYQKCTTVMGTPELMLNAFENPKYVDDKMLKSQVDELNQLIDTTWESWDKVIEPFRQYFSLSDSMTSDYFGTVDLKVISKKEYDIDGKIMSMSLTKQNDQLKFEINATVDTEEKAYLILGSFTAEFNNLKNEFNECLINIRYGDINVLYQQFGDTKIISGKNRDGSFVMSIPDWINKDINNLVMPKNEVDEYVLNLETNIKDFGESCGYKMGTLLE